MRRVTHAVEEVDDVEETLKRAVAELLADRNEDVRNAGGNTDGVLDIEVLVDEISRDKPKRYRR